MAESAHVAGRPGYIMVYNNNPLNITTSGSDYHQFGGNRLHFANYSGSSAGADAWFSLLSRKTSYRGIITALKAEDPTGLASAVGRSPWGTSTAGILGVMRRMGMDLSTGTNVGDGTAGAANNGKTVFQNELTKWLEQNNIAANSAVTQKQYDAFLVYLKGVTGIDISGEPNIIALGKSSVGKPWTELIGKTDKMDGTPSTDPITGIATALQSFADFFTDPARNTARFVHVGAIVAGGLAVGFGVYLMIKGASAGGLSAGGSGGGNITVYEDFGEDEIKDVEEEVTQETPAPKPPPKRTTKPRGPVEYDEPIDNTANNPGSNTFAPRRETT
jgi:hypothetical protein